MSPPLDPTPTGMLHLFLGGLKCQEPTELEVVPPLFTSPDRPETLEFWRPDPLLAILLFFSGPTENSLVLSRGSSVFPHCCSPDGLASVQAVVLLALL